ncbi:flagellin [Bacillus salitolerans]|uniref:Flagellin n=1 Tax=Bacillus salitolerans TaxID=1437434 RepID=A0ABW4LRN2_9BACI
MIINNNVPALNTYRQLGFNNKANAASMEKLSSGLRINRAGDDAAGLAISEKMRGQIRGLNQATRNAQDGISLIQTAEGALNETHSILQRMRELADQASNDTNTSVDRGEIQKEINQLSSEINRIANTTEFNTKKVLNGNVGEKVGEVRAIAEFGLNATITAAQTVSFEGQNFNYTSGAANTTAAAGSQTFNDINSLAEAFKNNTTIAEKYDVSVTSDNKIRLTQKFGKAAAGAITGPTGTAVNASLYEDVRQGTVSTTNQSLKMQIGANQNQSMSIDINDMSSKSLGITASGGTTGYTSTNVVTNGTSSTTSERALDVSTHSGASAAISVINNAIETVSAERSKLGAFQNRLDHTINNLGTSAENLQAAESRIRDVDMAAEMMKFTKSNILAQASQSMLAQANQKPQSVLQLLG